MTIVRYAYAITTALLLGGTAATMVLQPPAGAQTAQNDKAVLAGAPRAGAPASFADLVAKLQPAVVNISTTQRVTVSSNPFAGTPFGELFGGQPGGQGGQGSQGGGRPVTRQAESLGSGFLISADGYIVTNAHVISAGNRNATVEEITVTLTDRREYKAKLVGRDTASDLAVLKIEGTALPFVRFGDSNAARVGDWIVAIGNPFGLGGTVTAGIISAVHRVTGAGAYDRFIQTDASINRGNSGGPVFDLNGNVIGIASQILSPTGGSVGIGFAIPAGEAKPIIDQLMKGATVKRGYLGVGIQQITADIADALALPRGKGELISRVEPGEAAAKAGIRQGDVVVRVNGKDVTPDTTLSYLVANIAPGTTIPVELIRDGKRQTLNVTVGTRPPEEQLAGLGIDGGDDEDGDGTPGTGQPGAGGSAIATSALGLTVTQITPVIARSLGIDAATRGVVIVQADPSSDAAGKGLQRGDVIVSANRVPVTTPADLGRVITQAKTDGRKSVLLFIQRRAEGRFVAVEMTGQ